MPKTWYNSEIFSTIATNIYVALLPKDKVFVGDVFVYLEDVKTIGKEVAQTTGQNGYIVLTRTFHGLNLCEPPNAIAVLAHEIGHWVQSMQESLAQVNKRYLYHFGSDSNANLALDITAELLVSHVVPWTTRLLSQFVQRVIRNVKGQNAERIISAKLIEAYRLAQKDDIDKQTFVRCVGDVLAYIRFVVLPEALMRYTLSANKKIFNSAEDLPYYHEIIRSLSPRESQVIRAAFETLAEFFTQIKRTMNHEFGPDNGNITASGYRYTNNYMGEHLAHIIEKFLGKNHRKIEEFQKQKGKKEEQDGSQTTANKGEQEIEGKTLPENDQPDDKKTSAASPSTYTNEQEPDEWKQLSSPRLKQARPKPTKMKSNQIRRVDCTIAASCRAPFKPEEVMLARLVAIHVWPQKSAPETRGMPQYRLHADLREDPIPFRRPADDEMDEANRPICLVTILDISGSMQGERYKAAQTITNALLCAAGERGISVKLAAFGAYMVILENATRYPDASEFPALHRACYLVAHSHIETSTSLKALPLLIGNLQDDSIIVIITDGETDVPPTLSSAIRQGVYITQIRDTKTSTSEIERIRVKLGHIAHRVTIGSTNDLRTAVIATLPANPKPTRSQRSNIMNILRTLGITSTILS